MKEGAHSVGTAVEEGARVARLVSGNELAVQRMVGELDGHLRTGLDAS